MQEPLARATAASFRPVIVRLLKARVKSPARDDSPIMPNHQPSALVLIIEVKRVLAYDCRRTRNNPGLGIMSKIMNAWPIALTGPPDPDLPRQSPEYTMDILVQQPAATFGDEKILAAL